MMFHALFRKKEDESPSVTPLENQRNLQIEKLKDIHKNAVEVVRFTDYRIQLQTPKANITLIILLPPYFPQDKPEIQISPPVLHPWVNEHQKVIGCPGLKNFTVHSDLSKIVQDIISEFQMRPPVVDIAAHTVPKAPPPPFIPPEMSTMVGMSLAQPFSFYSPPGLSSTAWEMPCCFPELREFTKAELEHINSNDDALIEVVERLPVMQVLEKEMEKIAKFNEALAKENVSQQPRIEEAKKIILDKVDDLAIYRNTFDEETARFQDLAQRFLPSSIRNELKVAAMKAEEQSENYALKYLENKMDTEEFLTKFMDSRTLYHLRRVKEEKLHQQLLELQKSNY